MRNPLELQERFLKETSPMRLGHLASDLARASDLLKMRVGPETIQGVLQESKFFAEWTGTAGDLSIEIKTLLAEIQSFVTQKELEWEALSKNLEWRANVARQLRVWSDELLKKTGLLEEE